MTNPDETAHAWDEYVALFASRNELAEQYARDLLGFGPTWRQWPNLNAAILRRWSPYGLNYIKTSAWRIAAQMNATGVAAPAVRGGAATPKEEV